MPNRDKHITPKALEQPEAVEFAEWLARNFSADHGEAAWYRKKDGGIPFAKREYFAAIELYKLFKTINYSPLPPITKNNKQ